jgi:peroxiredoxin
MTQEGGRSRRYVMARAAAILLPVVLVAAIVGVIVARRGAGQPTGPDLSTVTFVASPVPQDRPAPAFRLPALSGTGSVSLAQYPRTIVVLNLWASWCGPCRQESPDLESVWRLFGSLNVQFLGVDEQDSRASAGAFVTEFGLTYPMAFDASGTLATSYGAIGLPSTYVIDGSGTIRFRFLGRVDPADLRSVLHQLLAESG